MSSEFPVPAELLASLRAASRVCVFSGAGVSAESGIATFRQPDTGLWSRLDPMTLATPEAFARDPALVWGWYEWRRAAVLRAQPNPAHRAVAALAQRLPAVSVVTQNVDDLHERGGSADVVHLHGSIAAARCSRCAAPWAHPAGIPAVSEGDEKMAPPRLPLRGGAAPQGGAFSSWGGPAMKMPPPPACADCGGPVRPGVVWFGESLPMDAWARAERLASECDVFFCVGTSGLVYPAAGLPMQALAAGARLVLVNPEPTPLDSRAHWSLSGPAGLVLPAIVRALDG